MNIVLTGSLGHISKPLTKILVEKGHSVTVISSKAERQKDIQALGAKAAIGTMEDADFLTTTFKGADAVYCMIALGNTFFDQDFDIMADTLKVGNNYRQAIRQSGVKRVVFLSSIGAHTDKGNGILGCYYHIENALNELPQDIAITFMRPAGFYYNLLSFIDTIKAQGIIATNYGGNNKKPWVSTIDIAAAVAEEIINPQPPARKIRYVASDEISSDEIAAILGEAINKPELKWLVISAEQQLNAMLTAGINPQIARGLVEMNSAINSGDLYEDYNRNKPTLGKVKMTDFAKEFAQAFFKS